MFVGTVFLLAVIAAGPALAQSPREPWTLTLEERIALRTDTVLAQQRVGSGKHVQTEGERPATRETRSIVDSFDGKTHPELFLPHEVFDELIRLAFLGPPRVGQVVRDGFLAEVKCYGLPADFWLRLQSVSAVYISDSAAVTDIGSGVRQKSGSPRQRAEEALELKQADVCRRSDALAAARSEFGHDRFERFLYEVIAVKMFYASDRLMDADVLRKAERGCR